MARPINNTSSKPHKTKVILAIKYLHLGDNKQIVTKLGRPISTGKKCNPETSNGKTRNTLEGGKENMAFCYFKQII